MSATSGPNIVENGLVFAFDPGDERSLIGEPTTNFVTDPVNMSGWSNYYRTTASSQFMTEFGTTGYRFTNQPSWNGIYKGVTVPSAGTYTASAWIRYIGGSAANNGATVYISGYGAADIAAFIDKTKVNEWQRVSITFSATNTSFNLFFISYGGTDNGTGNPDFSSWEVTMPQLEAKSYATPFANGTRNTANDISENRSLLAVNSIPIYSSNNNGSIVFDGVDDCIVIGNPLDPIAYGLFADSTSYWSVSSWFKPSSSVGTITGKSGGTGASATYIVWMSSTTTLSTRLRGGTILDISSSITSNWYEVVITWNGTIANAYLNGEFVNSVPVGTAAKQASNFSIGATAGGLNTFYSGNISNVRVYNRALSLQEIQQNYNALRGRFGV